MNWELIHHLLSQKESLDADYASGPLDREAWVKGLRDLNDKLSIFGLSLTSRPWETGTASKF